MDMKKILMFLLLTLILVVPVFGAATKFQDTFTRPPSTILGTAEIPGISPQNDWRESNGGGDIEIDPLAELNFWDPFLVGPLWETADVDMITPSVGSWNVPVGKLRFRPVVSLDSETLWVSSVSGFQPAPGTTYSADQVGVELWNQQVSIIVGDDLNVPPVGSVVTGSTFPYIASNPDFYQLDFDLNANTVRLRIWLDAYEGAVLVVDTGILPIATTFGSPVYDKPMNVFRIDAYIYSQILVDDVELVKNELNSTGDNYIYSNMTLTEDYNLNGTIFLMGSGLPGSLTFDCDNHWLTGNWTTAIQLLRNRTKIINCNFRNYSNVINFSDEHYTDFELNNDHFEDCEIGVNTESSTFTDYKTYNSTFDNMSLAAIYIDVPGRTTGEIVNITATNSGRITMYLDNGADFVLNDSNLSSGNTLMGGSLLINHVIMGGFELSDSIGSMIDDLSCNLLNLNYVNDSVFNDLETAGLRITDSNNLSMSDIRVYDVGNFSDAADFTSGINISQNSHNITITGSEIINTTGPGIFISDPTTSGITINDTNVFLGAGITISNSGLHIITNNWIEYVSPTLFYSYFIADNYNNVVENNAFDNGAINRIQPYITSPSGTVNKDTTPQVTILWGALAFNPTRFHVQHSPNNVDWTDIGNVAGTETSISWTISGLPTGIRYFRVYGVDAYGTSELDFPNSVARITISTEVSAGGGGGGGGGGAPMGEFEINFSGVPLDARLVVIDSIGRELFNSLVSNAVGVLYLNRGQYNFIFSLPDGSTVSYMEEITDVTQLSLEGKVVQKDAITGAVVGDEGEEISINLYEILGKVWKWLKKLIHL